MGEAEKAPKPRLRWYQYRLAHLFVLVTLAAIGCSWFACKMVDANKQKQTVKAIEGFGGHAVYDYQLSANDSVIPNAEPPGPAWFRNLVGLDLLADVAAVWFDGPVVPEAGLRQVKRLDTLEILGLACTHVTDSRLQHIESLANLRQLFLNDTQITDGGLEYLRGLTGLETLNLSGTQVTNEGVKELQQALPNCEISY